MNFFIKSIFNKLKFYLFQSSIIAMFVYLYTIEFDFKNTSIFTNSQEINNSIWSKASSTNNILRKLTINEFYLENENCQATSSSCKISPNKPKPREGHSSITFKTYNITEASRMCPPNYCGPFCNVRMEPSGNNICFINNSTADDIPLLEPNARLEGLLNSNNTNCPPLCCLTNNELCLRTYDISGRKVDLDQEVRKIFY